MSVLHIRFDEARPAELLLHSIAEGLSLRGTLQGEATGPTVLQVEVPVELVPILLDLIRIHRGELTQPLLPDERG
ncbi:MAG: hypothetical protein U0869_07990 [Chloroflexota bacterium]